MKKGLNRREFLSAAAVASATAAVAAAGPVGQLVYADKMPNGHLRFRAVAGLPKRPLPSYATYILEGHVDLKGKTGSMTRVVMAGHPESGSQIALPGLSRIVRVTDVRRSGSTVHVRGTIDDRAQLQKGESADVEVWLDLARNQARTSFFGSDTELRLEQ
jgi:hypothetical protein